MGRLRLEWLRFLDQCPYFGWEPSDLWTTVHLELAGVHEDRIGGSTSRSLASRPDGVIEARSEIVDGVAQEKRPLVDGAWRSTAKHVYSICPDALTSRLVVTPYASALSKALTSRQIAATCSRPLMNLRCAELRPIASQERSPRGFRRGARLCCRSGPGEDQPRPRRATLERSFGGRWNARIVLAGGVIN
jgi:hypothetical protein